MEKEPKIALEDTSKDEELAPEKILSKWQEARTAEESDMLGKVLTAIRSAEAIEEETAAIIKGYEDSDYKEEIRKEKIGSYLCGDGARAGEFSIMFGREVSDCGQVNIQGIWTGVFLRHGSGRPEFDDNPTGQKLKELVDIHNQFVESIISKDERLLLIREVLDRMESEEHIIKKDDPLVRKIREADVKGLSIITDNFDFWEKEEVDLRGIRVNIAGVLPREFYRTILETPECMPILKDHAKKMAKTLKEYVKLSLQSLE